MTRFSSETVLDRSSVTYLDVGISLFSARGIDDRDAIVDCVTVYERGAYDKVLPYLTRPKPESECRRGLA